MFFRSLSLTEFFQAYYLQEKEFGIFAGNSEKTSLKKRKRKKLWRSICEVKLLAERAANSETPVIITGETGTGKEMFAHAIHNNSSRAGKPFLVINCSAIPETLSESYLFGYEEGSFTGASRNGRVGLFEACDGGTVVLDEIGEMNPLLQAKLLRVVEQQEVIRVGSFKPIPINVRVIASTNRDLWQMAKAGTFRQDLIYRLSVFNLVIPPLRERLDDIPLLVDHFIRTIAPANNKKIRGITREALDYLFHYSWPGNIRELKNVIEQAITVSESSLLQVKDLPRYLTNPMNSLNPSLKEVRDAAEKVYIAQILQIVGGNRQEAANLLNISLSTLCRKLRQHALI
ncbi:MAG: sigma-54 dependent transcriptional regulator [Bacillota bacterium]